MWRHVHLACSLARAMLVHAACRERRRAERALWIRGHLLRKQGGHVIADRGQPDVQSARDQDVHALRAWAFQNAQGYSFMKAGPHGRMPRIWRARGCVRLHKMCTLE